MSGVIWNQLAFPWIVTLILSVFTSCSSDLTFLMLKEKSWFYHWRFFSKTINFIPCHFKLFVYHLLAEIFFCLWPTIKHFPLSFKKCRMSMNCCSLFTGSYIITCSLRIISLRHPFGLPVWNFGRPRVNSRSLRLPDSR